MTIVILLLLFSAIVTAYLYRRWAAGYHARLRDTDYIPHGYAKVTWKKGDTVHVIKLKKR